MSGPDTSTAWKAGSTHRTLIAAAITLVVLTGAVAAGLLSSSDGGAPVIFVESLSARVGEVASGAVTRLWWAYAFLLGAVAAFNPCGFGLLPAYLGIYLNDEHVGHGVGARMRRALRVSVSVAAAFTILFGATGALFSLASSIIVPLLPWAGLATGVFLVIAGGVILSGRSLAVPGAQHAANRLGRAARTADTRGYTTFGLAYGLASLGCTLPFFLALVGTASAAGGPLGALGAFMLYGAGMATTLAVLTLTASIAGSATVTRFRAMVRFLPGMGAALVFLSGAFVLYYWLTAGRFLLF